MRLSYDFHIHSCLSPCGDNDMTPNNIVNMAAMLGLDAIAVSDHNSCQNLPAVFELAEKSDLLVVPAMEACTSEEVHMLCLFGTLAEATAFDKELYGFLPPIDNKEEFFGKQLIMDCEDNIIGHEKKLLVNALTISIDKLLRIISKYDAIAIPAHVDKNANSIISNLGYIPEEYNFCCIEQKDLSKPIDFCGNKITNSDAHYLEHINEPVNFIDVSQKTASAIISALKNK